MDADHRIRGAIMSIIVITAALVIAAVVGTIVEVSRDGYGHAAARR